MEKHRLISINIKNLWSCLALLMVHWNTTQWICHRKTWKICSSCKKHFFNKCKYLYLRCYFFSSNIVNVNNVINISNITINTKILNIPFKSSFFTLSTDQSFEMFPRHNRAATISESFALNCKFLYHWQRSNNLLRCNASSNKISFLSL